MSVLDEQFALMFCSLVCLSFWELKDLLRWTARGALLRETICLEQLEMWPPRARSRVQAGLREQGLGVSQQTLPSAPGHWVAGDRKSEVRGAGDAAQWCPARARHILKIRYR